MGNEGPFELALLGVNGQPVRHPATLVSYMRSTDGQEIGRLKRSFPPIVVSRCLPFPKSERSRARSRRSDTGSGALQTGLAQAMAPCVRLRTRLVARSGRRIGRPADLLTVWE